MVGVVPYEWEVRELRPGMFRGFCTCGYKSTSMNNKAWVERVTADHKHRMLTVELPDAPD